MPRLAPIALIVLLLAIPNVAARPDGPDGSDASEARAAGAGLAPANGPATGPEHQAPKADEMRGGHLPAMTRGNVADPTASAAEERQSKTEAPASLPQAAGVGLDASEGRHKADESMSKTESVAQPVAAIPLAAQENVEEPFETAPAQHPTAFMGASAADEPSLESQRRWIGGLLNATNEAQKRESDAQTASAVQFRSSWLLLVLGIGVGASGSALGLRRVARRGTAKAVSPGPAPRREAIGALVDHVARAPMDAAACFRLAVELFRLGIEADGLRLLDRSIRIDPMLIVQLLQEPQLGAIRQSAGVQRLLAGVKRDYDRRLLTGYA